MSRYQNRDWDGESTNNVIPKMIWDVVNEKLSSKKYSTHRRGSAGGGGGVWIRKFSYNVEQEAWIGECYCIQEQNLFFENLSNLHPKDGASTISDEYISIQFGDGTTNLNSRSKFVEKGENKTVTSNESNNNSSGNESVARAYYYQADSIREKMLRNGVRSPNGDDFQLLGCSNSQVRNYSFLFRCNNISKRRGNKCLKNITMMNNKELLQSILPGLDELEQKKGVSKRVKYTGLLFSGVQCFVDLPKSTIIREIPSVESNRFDFTDGVGLISLKLAREITKQMTSCRNKKKKNQFGNDVPSVFQIRYGGAIQQLHSEGRRESSTASYVCKGVLLVDPTENERYMISFRKSMLKIELAPQGSGNGWARHMNFKLGIVDYSKNKVGKLNQQLICLLSANVPHDDLRRIQSFHLDRIRQSWRDPFSLGYLVAMEDNERFWNLYEDLILHSKIHGYKRMPSAYISLAQRRSRYCNEAGKLQIHLGQSRTVFGAAFPECTHSMLNDGQCLFFTDRGLLVNTVIVSRSPSYTPGDVRVLNSVDLPSDSPLRQLRNCIIFSTSGDRPDADKMSGGDLDGDQYLVIWDERLTKYAVEIGKEKPEDYSGASPVNGGPCAPKEDWIDYVSRFDNSILGVVDRAFYTTAKEKGIKSQEAKTLNNMFTSLVDKNPASLQRLEELIMSNYMPGRYVPSTESLCIWEEMQKSQMECGVYIRSKKMFPDLEDYSIFQQSLLDDPRDIFTNIKSFYGHFQANINPEKLKLFVQYLDKVPLKKLNRSHTDEPTPKIADLNSKFNFMYKCWEENSHKVFALALEKWDKNRQKLLKDLNEEREKRESQLAIINKERTQLQSLYDAALKNNQDSLTSVDIEYEKQCSQYINQLMKKKSLLQSRIQKNTEYSEDLKQSLLKQIHQEIRRLRDNNAIYCAQIKEKQEEIKNHHGGFLSYLLDSERWALSKTINVLENEKEKNLSILSRVQDQERMLENGHWRHITEFSAAETNDFSKEFHSCFQLGKKWTQINLEVQASKGTIRDLDQSMYELNQLKKDFREGKWRSSHTTYDVEQLAKCTQDFFQGFEFELKLSIARREITILPEQMLSIEIELKNLNERQNALLNGSLWNEIEFNAKKVGKELKEKKIQAKTAHAKLETISNALRETNRELQSSNKELSKYRDDMSHRIKLEKELELLVAMEGDLFQFFDSKMMTQSSYCDLQLLVNRNEDSDPFWTQIAQNFFGVKINISDIIEEEPDVLYFYFNNANEAQHMIHTEGKKRLQYKTTKTNNLKKKRLCLQDELDEIVSQTKSLKSNLKKVMANLAMVKNQFNRLTSETKGKGKDFVQIVHGILVKRGGLIEKKSFLQLELDNIEFQMKSLKSDHNKMLTDPAVINKKKKRKLTKESHAKEITDNIDEILVEDERLKDTEFGLQHKSDDLVLQRKVFKTYIEKEDLLEKLKHLKLCIETAITETKVKKDDISILDQELDQIMKNYKSFTICCEDFESIAKVALNGELVGGVSSVLFRMVQNVIRNVGGLSNLAKIFEQHEMKKRARTSDKEIFLGYKFCIDEARNMYSPQSLAKLQQNINKESKTHESLVLKMAHLQEQTETLQYKCSDLTEDVKELETELSSLKVNLKKTFCKQRMEELKTKWDDSSHEDSLNCAIKSINRALEIMQKDWNEKYGLKNKNTSFMEQELQKMNKNIQRMIDIEENRILGFPRKNGQRPGRLTVYDKRAELQRALKESNIVIITAGTGCGKSTQLPQYIVDDFYTHTPMYKENRKFFRICCTQPRRLAAQGVAARVAEEYYTPLGDMVGFRVGRRNNASESQKISKNTRIEFVTEGLLLYQLTKSPETIKNFDCIIVDEAHERNKETDLLLALLRQHLEGPRFTLKLVVMSATIDPTKFSQYFGGCPTLDCPGKTYPVTEYFIPAPKINEERPLAYGMIDIDHAVNTLFKMILEKYGTSANYEDGDVLIFLSSSAQITLCVNKINKKAQDEGMLFVVAYPLFSQMPEKDKEAAKDPNHRTGLDKITNGKHVFSRKIICCTNIAETSLTIDGVRFVMEGGYAKKPMYDHRIRSMAISERKVSQASAKQRKGRAGRTAPGRCYYLYSKSELENREEFDVPQILDKPVDELIMYSLNVCGKSIEHLGLMDCPDETKIDAAKERLSDIEMIKIDKEYTGISLTKDGEIACRLSHLNPQAVRMILSSRTPELDCLDRAIKLGAILSSEEDIFFSRNVGVDSNDIGAITTNHDLGDHFLILSIFENFEEKKKNNKRERQMRKWCKNNGLIYYVIDRIQNAVEQTYKDMKKFKHLKEGKITPPSCKSTSIGDKNECLLRAFVSGYFSQIGEYGGSFFLKHIGFSMLGHSHDSVNPRLARDSCLFRYLVDGDFDDNEAEYEDSDDENDKSELKIVKDEFQRTAANFIIYTDMFSIQTKNNMNLILIPKVSLIHGKLITLYAPEKWRQRVEFDENKTSICRRTLSSIGRDFQKAALDLYQKKDHRNNLQVLLQILWEKNKLILYGKAEPVGEVTKELKALFADMKIEKLRKDVGKYSPDWSTFGPGLEVKSIRNIEPKDGLVAKPVQKMPKNQTSHYWHIKNQGNKQVTVFVNEGNDSFLFCDILKKLLPENQCTCKAVNGKVNIMFTDKEQQNVQQSLGAIVKEALKNNSNLFFPVSVDQESIGIAIEIHDNFSTMKKSEMWQYLEYEWVSCLPFWQNFCGDVEKTVQSKKCKTKVKYSTAKACFEIYTTNETSHEQVKNILKERLLKISLPKNYYIYKPQFTKITKAVLWKLAAIIGEMRLLFASIRFTVIHPMLPESLGGGYSDYSNEAEGGVITHKVHSDMTYLLHLHDQQDFILQHTFIRLQSSTPKSRDMKEAKDMLEKYLPSKVPVEHEPGNIVQESGKKLPTTVQKCFMCKRKLYFERKGDKKIKVSKDCKGTNEENLPIGYRLTLCGCTFCRECFVNSASLSMKNQEMAQCAKCDSTVLAQDCENITNAFYWKMKKKEQEISKLVIAKYKADWEHLVTLSYNNYCSKYVQLLSTSMATLMCKSCSAVMLYKKSYNFIYCRNMSCNHLICTSCGKAPHLSKNSKCLSNRCQK